MMDSLHSIVAKEITDHLRIDLSNKYPAIDVWARHLYARSIITISHREEPLYYRTIIIGDEGITHMNSGLCSFADPITISKTIEFVTSELETCMHRFYHGQS